MTGISPLISVQPEDLQFEFELEKQSYCDLKVFNNTEHHVAFKVKTTSPKKYFVRPNTGVVQPWDSSTIRVTLQAQREYPPNMHCKDKFLLQSTVVPARTDLDELPQDTFNKESGKVVEERKLRVVYTYASAYGDSEDEALRSSKSSPETTSNQALLRLKEERDSAVWQTKQLQQELAIMKRRSSRSGTGFSFKFALLVGLIGIMVGFLLNFSLSSPSPDP